MYGSNIPNHLCFGFFSFLQFYFIQFHHIKASVNAASNLSGFKDLMKFSLIFPYKKTEKKLGHKDDFQLKRFTALIFF